jgi:flagellar basal-body rod modification protein FlgD
MATNPVGSGSSTDSTSSSSALNGFGSLKLDDFMKMLLAELQNQDPLSPMDASQMLTQIGQITQVGSTQQLTSTLDSVLLGQNVNNATSLIGKTIAGLDDTGKDVVGKVDKVTITNGKPVLSVGDTTVKIENVRAVLPDANTDGSDNSSTAAAQLADLLKQLQESQQAQQSTPAAAAT